METYHWNETFTRYEGLWRQSPAERTPEYFRYYSRAAVALQQALREHLSARFFASPHSYADLMLAYPMILYVCSRPNGGTPPADFMHDVLNPDSIRRFFWFARQTFGAALSRAHARLAEAGEAGLARAYRPFRAPDILALIRKQVKTSRALNRLLAAETLLWNELLKLRAGESAIRFEKAWKLRLKRIYPGLDCSDFAAALFVRVSEALLEAPLREEAA